MLEIWPIALFDGELYLSNAASAVMGGFGGIPLREELLALLRAGQLSNKESCLPCCAGEIVAAEQCEHEGLSRPSGRENLPSYRDEPG